MTQTKPYRMSWKTKATRTIEYGKLMMKERERENKREQKKYQQVKIQIQTILLKLKLKNKTSTTTTITGATKPSQILYSDEVDLYTIQLNMQRPIEIYLFFLLIVFCFVLYFCFS